MKTLALSISGLLQSFTEIFCEKLNIHVNNMKLIEKYFMNVSRSGEPFVNRTSNSSSQKNYSFQ